MEEELSALRREVAELRQRVGALEDSETRRQAELQDDADFWADIARQTGQPGAV